MSNGYIEVGEEWMAFNGAKVIDINGAESEISSFAGDKWHFETPQSAVIHLWYGGMPNTKATRGAQTAKYGNQYAFTQGANDLFIKATVPSGYDTVDLIVAKVE